MKRLEQLDQIANQALGGLTAGPEMKARILEKAGRSRSRVPMRALSAALAMALVAAVVIGVPLLTPRGGDPLISTQPLGSVDPSAGIALMDLHGGSVTISQSAGTPAFRSIYADNVGGSFPLVCVQGRYYRMLALPDSVPSSLLGQKLGVIGEYTTEPALSGTDGLLSNIASSGAEVYEIAGMDGTLVAARVGSSLRLFQRASYNNTARRGKESLESTLQIRGHVIAMELSGVGVVTDPAVCARLTAVLLDNAVYKSSGSLSASQSLLIALDNGLTLQLAVKNDSIGGCGVWSCPDFIDAFASAAK